MNKKQIQELRNLIAEIEGQTILFDSDNWPKYQRTCIEWGDRVAPFLEAEERKKFNRELDTIRAVITEPVLSHQFTGTIKASAFNKMKGIATQRLQELEKGITISDGADEAIHLPSKVTLGWLFRLLSRLSIGSWSLLLSTIVGAFLLGYQVGHFNFHSFITTRQTQERNQSSPSAQAIITTARKVNMIPVPIEQAKKQK